MFDRVGRSEVVVKRDTTQTCAEAKGHNVFVERGEATKLQVAFEEKRRSIICIYPAGTWSSVIIDGSGLASNGS